MVQTTWATDDFSPRRHDGRNTAKYPLSAAWIQLFELCRDNPYGQFHELPFLNGEPIVTGKPKFVLTFKLGKDDGLRKPLAEIANHERAVSLRRLLAHWQNGTLHRLTVRDGIPDVVDIKPEDQA